MTVTTHTLQGWNLLERGAEVKIAEDQPVEAIVFYEDAPLDEAVIATQIVALTGTECGSAVGPTRPTALACSPGLEVQGQKP